MKADSTIACIILLLIMFIPVVIVIIIDYIDNHPFTQSKIIVKLKGIDSMEWIQLWGISTLVICIAGAFLIKFI